MTDQDKKLIRAFYQGLASDEEKDLFFKVLNMSNEDKAKYLAGEVLKKYGMDSETRAAIMAVSHITKDELVQLAAQEVRKVADGLIARFINWITGFFG